MVTPKSKYACLSQPIQSWKTDEKADVYWKPELSDGPPPKQIRAPLSFTPGFSFCSWSCSPRTKDVTCSRRHDCHAASSGDGVDVAPVWALNSATAVGL